MFEYMCETKPWVRPVCVKISLMTSKNWLIKLLIAPANISALKERHIETEELPVSAFCYPTNIHNSAAGVG